MIAPPLIMAVAWLSEKLQRNCGSGITSYWKREGWGDRGGECSLYSPLLLNGDLHVNTHMTYTAMHSKQYHRYHCYSIGMAKAKWRKSYHRDDTAVINEYGAAADTVRCQNSTLRPRPVIGEHTLQGAAMTVAPSE